MILRKRTEDRYSEVLPTWKGETCVIIAGGPSLTLEQVEAVDRCAGRVYCIAVNNAYLWAPWADVHYAADAHWHKWHSDGVDIPVLGLSARTVREQWAAFSGQKCTIQHRDAVVADKAVHVLRNLYHPDQAYGLSSDPTALITGRHSGWQAINLAVLAGAKTLLLLGYDGQPGPHGKAHWFGQHPKIISAGSYSEWIRSFVHGEADLKAAGVRVINCSPGTAIKQFEKMTIEEALDKCIACAAERV